MTWANVSRPRIMWRKTVYPGYWFWQVWWGGRCLYHTSSLPQAVRYTYDLCASLKRD